MSRAVFALLALAACSPAAPPVEAPVNKSCLHAHNDYLHARPLFDALDHHACSIEADVHLVDGALLVAHDANQVMPGRTLESLYLDPLRANGTHDITLLIDVKTDARTTYPVLRDTLLRYTDLQITYLISGNRDVEQIAGDDARPAAIDGVLADLDLDPPPASDLVPLVSDDWRKYFTWVGGMEKMPVPERKKLVELVEKAHAQQRRIRFWDTFDLFEVWQELADAGVDLIGADDIEKLDRFLQTFE